MFYSLKVFWNFYFWVISRTYWINTPNTWITQSSGFQENGRQTMLIAEDWNSTVTYWDLADYLSDWQPQQRHGRLRNRVPKTKAMKSESKETKLWELTKFCTEEVSIEGDVAAHTVSFGCSHLQCPPSVVSTGCDV